MIKIQSFNNKNEGSNPVKKKNSVHMATGNDENVDGDENKRDLGDPVRVKSRARVRALRVRV